MEETTNQSKGRNLKLMKVTPPLILPPCIEPSYSTGTGSYQSLNYFRQLRSNLSQICHTNVQATAKLLIKDESNSNRRGSSLQNMSNLGIISNSTGIDNEMEILTSHSLAEDAIRDLKLYVNYSQRRVKDVILYRNQPLNVDVDPGISRN